jgi:exodeoxyribonuclease-3
VAVLARKELGGLVETARDLPGQEQLGARLLGADVGDLSFTTLYVPNGKSVEHEDFPRKLGWLDALADHAEASIAAGKSAIFCGDFNLCPTRLDSWNEDELAGSIFHTPEERARFARLEAAGLHDLFRRTRGEDRLYSWWDYRAGAFPMNRGLRIDLILGTDPVLQRVNAVTIDRDFRKKKEGLTPSDHAPVLVELA